MNDLNQILLEEIPYFNEYGYKFLNGEISSNEFKKISGGMGVYSHRNKKEFMIRLKFPSGLISFAQFKLVYGYAKKYNLESIHLTTRQAIQLHGVSIDAVCQIMKDGIKNGIYTRGSGGNFPRNVAMSALSGVDKDEAFDVTLYALAVNNHFMKKIYEYKLPRKLKVAFSNNRNDNSHCMATDLGFLAIKKDGKDYFKVFIGGGLGKNPAIGLNFDEFVEPEDVLYHVEALTNLFIDEGDYENKSKARIRYIVDRMGKEEFLKCYKNYLDKEKEKQNMKLNIEHIQYNKKGIYADIKNTRLIPQRQDGLYSVYFHPIGGILNIKSFELIIDELEKYDNPKIRLTMTEGIMILNLNGKEAKEFLEVTKSLGANTKLEQSIACIGVPICQIGIVNGQETLEKIIAYFKEKDMNEDILPSIHISGCLNSCAVHEIVPIGLSGKKKNIDGISQDVFELHIGGKASKLGKVYQDILKDKVPELLYEIAIKVKDKNISFEEFILDNENELEELIKYYLV